MQPSTVSIISAKYRFLKNSNFPGSLLREISSEPAALHRRQIKKAVSINADGL
ncbi:MAG: hypothetical protein IKG08_03660 [Eubacterium sp.]|nr:hypothetical protein [Eubacterium sp.]MBR3275690.1 hypothetical protein [Eubacterium sp.]